MSNKTNGQDVQAHLKRVFERMFETDQLHNYAVRAGNRLKKGIREAVASSPYNYDQSGNLLKTINRSETAVLIEQNKATIGFGNIDIFNTETRRLPQHATFKTSNGDIEVSLRPEPELPSWIIAEFGRKAGVGGATPSGIPSRFVVPYTPRDDDKKFLFGPSDTRHYMKPIYFMSRIPTKSQSSAGRIEGGHIFTRGLEYSKEKIRLELTAGIYASLATLARQNGNGGAVKIR